MSNLADGNRTDVQQKRIVINRQVLLATGPQSTYLRQIQTAGDPWCYWDNNIDGHKHVEAGKNNSLFQNPVGGTSFHMGGVHISTRVVKDVASYDGGNRIQHFVWKSVRALVGER